MIQDVILDVRNSKYLDFGERGIRTLGTNRSYNGLAICRFCPLGHLSDESVNFFSVNIRDGAESTVVYRIYKYKYDIFMHGW